MYVHYIICSSGHHVDIKNVSLLRGQLPHILSTIFSGMMFARNRGRRVSKEFEDLDIHTPTGLLLPPPLKGFRHFDKLPPIHPSSRPGSSHNLDSMSAENDLHWIGDPEAINSVRRPRKTAVQLHKDLIKHRSDSELRHHHVPPTTRRKAGCVHCAVHNRCLPGSPSSPENSRRFRPSCWEPNPGSPPQQGCSPPTKRLGTPIPHRVSPLPSTQHSTSVSPRSVRQVDMTYFVTGPRLHDKDSPPSSPCLACQNEKSAIQNIIDGLAQIKQPKPPSKKTPRSPTRKPKGIQNKVQPEASICSQTPAKRTTNGKKDPSEFQERPSDPVSTILDMLDEHKYDKFISSSVNRLLATDNEHKQHHK